MSSIINKFLSRYIIYTKILQWVNFDFLSFLGSDVNIFLKKFTDNAPYTNDDIDYESLDRLDQIGNKYDILINRIPINSGTISLVFKGTIIDNRIEKKIAIKVLRKNIKSKINDCITNIDWILSFMKYIPLIKTLNLDIIFNDVKENLLEQTNFEYESKNIKLFDSRLNKHKQIKTVKLIPELTFDNVIVMEFIDGKSVFHLNKEEKRLFSEILSTTIFFSQMKKRLFHLDLHPGNILYTNDGKITYLDLGMVMELEVNECNFILDFVNLLGDNENVCLVLAELFRNHKEIIFRDNIETNSLIVSIMNKRPNIFQNKDNLSFVMDTKFLIGELNRSGFKLNKRINQLLFGILSFVNIFINLGEDIYEITIKNMKKYTTL